MPELPEVETIRQDLRKKILNKKIVQVVVVREKSIRETKFALPEKLIGNKFEEIERVGKLIMFKLHKPALYLLVHLKMTGQLIYKNKNKITAGGHSLTPIDSGTKSHGEVSWELPDKHTQIIIELEKDGTLYFNDMRRFGYARLVTPEQKELIVATYGIEPLTNNFTLKNLTELFKKKKTNLKALLLNQAFIAGIGNIYADEICHLAGVLPNRNTSSLKDEEIKKIFQATQEVIKQAVKERGTTFNNYVDSDGKKGNFVRFLKVYERDKKNCLTCKKAIIQKKKIAGRGTHYCSVCQR